MATCRAGCLRGTKDSNCMVDRSLCFCLAAAAQKLGVSCAMPGAFQNVLLLAATARSYNEGIRTNIIAGGDNCSRCAFFVMHHAPSCKHTDASKAIR